ncbi:nucleotide sugar dehydrogenase [Candidatus Uhrbacteria bacterium]|nr:nucleotide sugar dehydrogenase [Candidatus Uhrbacteria bacterium]
MNKMIMATGNDLIFEKKVCVIGMGYVGLTLALTLSELGFSVTGIEKRERVVSQLEEGKSHFHEGGVNELLSQELGKGFKFLTAFSESIAGIYIVAVGTPLLGESKKPDFNDLESSIISIAKVLRQGDIVILRSTVPPGTTRDFVIPLLVKYSGLAAGKDFSIAFAPERTIEGDALNELRRLPQVIGGYDRASAALCADIFRTLTNKIVLLPTLEAAEMVKLVNNLYRDVTFAFANEVALICDKFNLDSHEVISAANFGYERSAVPQPSPGVGGYCLTKDPYILLEASLAKGFEPKLITQARAVNEAMPDYVCRQVSRFMEASRKSARDSKIFIAGLAFKGHPPTSDIRFSSGLEIAKKLQEKNFNVCGYDPVVPSEALSPYGLKFVNLEEGFRGADAAILATNHHDFKNLDIHRYLPLMKKPALIFDGWKLYGADRIAKFADIHYSNLGYDNIPGLPSHL